MTLIYKIKLPVMLFSKYGWFSSLWAYENWLRSIPGCGHGACLDKEDVRGNKACHSLEEALENQAQCLGLLLQSKQLIDGDPSGKDSGSSYHWKRTVGSRGRPLWGWCVIWARNKSLLLKPGNILVMIFMLEKSPLLTCIWAVCTFYFTEDERNVETGIMIYLIKVEHYETLSLTTFSKESW